MKVAHRRARSLDRDDKVVRYSMHVAKGEEGYIYLLGIEGHKVYKIGFSKEPKARLRSLKSQLSLPLYIVAVIYYSDHIRSRELEWQAYYDTYHLAGEWYALPDDSVEHFKSLAVQP